ncbi:MAG: MFS transporter [Candidatus Marinimicrobia bacterium CG08_land_8_20_14_0_20_45_22]|nr:MAG: MFS transporter [Candidatus Marinimicrobia bacterium CG08_land_8_20_14_0_20_45_22]
MTNSFEAVFRSLHHRNFRLYFYGQSISLIGTWIQRIAVPWLVYSLTDSAFLLGLVGFAGQIPTFLLTPFAGVLVDRWNRRTILITTQVLAMIQSLLLAFLFFDKSLGVWHIVFLSVFLGCINAFDMPVRQAFIVDMIEKRADLGNAIALNSSMVNSARWIGPSIAGVLISLTGEGICFLLNGISYIFVIVFLLLMKIPPQKENSQNTDVLQELKEGFNYTFGFTPIRYIIFLLALVSLMGMPYTVLMPVFAKNILHGGPHTFGFLMGASGIGALVGALYMASKKGVLGLGKNIPLFSAVFGVGLIAFALSRSFLFSLILLLITAFGMLIQMTASNTILQTITDDDKRGRVMSFYTMAFMGTVPFGSLLAGALASSVGAPNTLIIGGVTIIIGAVVFARKLPELRKMVHPIYIRLGIVPEVASVIQTATELTSPPEE